MPDVFAYRRRLSAQCPTAVCCFLLLFLLQGMSSAQWSRAVALQAEQGGDTAYDIRPLAGVDEELFFLNALEEIYGDWPSDNQQVGQWIANTRPLVSRLRALISKHRLDRDLAQVYDECLNLLDAVSRYLTNLGVIEQRTQDQSGDAALEVILKAVMKGGEEKLNGQSDEDARNAGLWEGLSTLIEKGYAISRERQAAIDAQKQKLGKQITDTMDSVQTVAQRLTRERGWQLGESGFDGSSNARLADKVNHRPRDPFVLCDYATAELKNENSAQGAMRRSNWCLRAAQLVPAGNDYDDYRALFVGEAADLALLATNFESSSNYTGGPTASTPQALRLTRTYLSFDPADSSGFGHAELARALAFSGRYGEALAAARVAAKPYEHDPGFALRYAKLMSLTGSLSQAGEWLAYAYSLGYSEVNYVRSSPDFANFRRGQAERFSELTTPRLRQPEFIWGLIMDDVVLHNDSPFALTNVVSKVWVRKGQQTWNLDLKCKSIPAGGSCKLENVASIPGDSYDEIRATFDCDQVAH